MLKPRLRWFCKRNVVDVRNVDAVNLATKMPSAVTPLRAAKQAALEVRTTEAQS